MHHLLRVLTRRAVALEFFCLGVRDLKRFRNRFGEVRAAERECANPTAISVCNDEIGCKRSDIEDDDRLTRVIESEVIRETVVCAHWTECHLLRADTDIAVEREALIESIFLNREDSDFNLR